MKTLGELQEQFAYWGFLEGLDAQAYLRLVSGSARRKSGRPAKYKTVAERRRAKARYQRTFRKKRLGVARNTLAAD